ncbi:hypothetical protein GUJ93_ZPchr0006g41421 [Zizania palustris]|uniref:Uncharacterized protein n=1 Tax=Zizania palustris TaxID=103762 RepID=A0A8J5TG91_ZIZPA|nr:hypothetical protein GUJ93_ZPchr0006g41421 [Zizania palustris]
MSFWAPDVVPHPVPDVISTSVSHALRSMLSRIPRSAPNVDVGPCLVPDVVPTSASYASCSTPSHVCILHPVFDESSHV